MYNCIQSSRRLPDTAYSGRLYPIQLKFLDPRILFISDGRIFLEKHTVNRYINCSDLRFLAKIVRGILRSVSVGKTYRHLRLGGIASGARIIGQQNDVFVSEHCHICNCVVVQSYHNLTKLSSLPCFLISFTTSRVLINTVAVLSHGWMPISLFSKSLSM